MSWTIDLSKEVIRRDGELDPKSSLSFHITNFLADDEGLFCKAIELYEREYPEEKGTIYIKNATDFSSGKLIPNYRSVHSKRSCCVEQFLEICRRNYEIWD